MYATELKTTLAGVPADLLAAHGPVSRRSPPPWPRARRRCGATSGSDSPVSPGPTAVDGYPPGRVYLGLSDGRRTVVHELDLPGDRATVRAGAVEAALRRLLDRFPEHPVRRELSRRSGCYAISGRAPPER